MFGAMGISPHLLHQMANQQQQNYGSLGQAQYNPQPLPPAHMEVAELPPENPDLILLLEDHDEA
jgi:hypothetical protein